MPILSLFIAIVSVIALSPLAGFAQSRQVRSLTKSEGLSDLLVNEIYKDSRGYIWFGSESAVDRFDGNSLMSFELPRNSGIKNRVNAILRVPSGDVFVGSQTGLFVIRNGTDEPQKLLSDKISSPVSALVSDRTGNIYIASARGVYSYQVSKKNLTKLNIGIDPLSPDDEIADIHYQDSGDVVWIASPRNLYRYDIASGKVTEFPMPCSGRCSRIALINNMIYLGIRGEGVLPFDIRISTFGRMLNFGNNLITDLSAGRQGNLYVATDGDGIFCYSHAEKRIVSHISTSEGEPKLKSGSVYSILTDELGVIWVGYYQMGVEYTPVFGDFFRTYAPAGVFDTRGKAIRSIAVDGAVKVIGSRDGLFLIDESDARVIQFQKPQLRSNIIFCIHSMGNGRFLIGTYNGGMYELDAATGTLADFNSSGMIQPNSSVFSMDVDKAGSLWVGTSEGLLRFRTGHRPDRWTFTDSQLPEGNVYEVFFDSAGRGWICTENGIALWNGTTLRSDRFPKDFIHKQKIRDIFEDSSHRLWFSPDRGALFSSDLHLSKYGPVKFGSDESVITMFTIEDNDGWLWLGTDNGLIRYDKNENFQHFNNADGLPGSVFTLCAPMKDNHGNLWMGNSEGLTILDFGRFKDVDNQSRKKLAITNMMSNGKSIISRARNVSKHTAISLGRDENDLVVFISDFSYKLPQYFVSEYFLEGAGDGKWHKTDGNKPIHLYDLPAGDYNLKIRAQDDPRTEISLTIHKSPELSWALTAIIILLAGGMAYTLYYIYIVRRRHRQIEETTVADDEASTYSSATPAEEQHISYRTTRLSDEECKRLLKALNTLMKNERPYTDPALKSSTLAAMIGTKSHSLSFLFNQYLKKSFYDYINEYRVEEFKRLVKETDISKYTLTALSERCGFSSRASFFRHFKAITGITPAEYIKQK